jgi:hypothetical protein
VKILETTGEGRTSLLRRSTPRAGAREDLTRNSHPADLAIAEKKHPDALTRVKILEATGEGRTSLLQRSSGVKIEALESSAKS